MVVRLTVVADPSTSRKKSDSRLDRGAPQCQSVSFFFCSFHESGTVFLRQPYSLLSPKLRYQTVACPLHLTMLSKLDAFCFSSYHSPAASSSHAAAPDGHFLICGWARRPQACAAAAGTIFIFPAVSRGQYIPSRLTLRSEHCVR